MAINMWQHDCLLVMARNTAYLAEVESGNTVVVIQQDVNGV